VTRERLDDYGWLFWYKLTKLGKENRTWVEFEDALDELIEVQPIQVNPTEAAVTGAS
jgi:hypothetical protein